MAATQWPQQYQQYQQQPQNYQQPQQYVQGQQYQQPQQPQAQQYQYQQQSQGYPSQQYEHNQQYQAYDYQQAQQGQPAQHYQQAQQGQPTQQYQQAQQGQPTQQYQQARQGPPVAQPYPQPQPSQPAPQYTQQQFQQPQQAHNSYQYQQTPHQYPPQQYAVQQPGSAPQHGTPPVHISAQQPVGPQQHNSPKYGAYQQASQPQHNPAQAQGTSQSTPQPCFNCGNAGHFAMDCPEPIRAVPAGKINPQAFQNPLRRPKSGGTVVKPPQYTAHPSQAQGSPQGYPSPPYGQTGYPQYQQAYSPATSQSAHSPAQAQYYQQWQQYYQSQQAYQQGNHHHQQGSLYHQQAYTAPHGQALGYSNGAQTPSQTPVQASQHTGSTQSYQSQFTPTSASSVQFNQETVSNKAINQPGQPNQSFATMNPQSTLQNLQATQMSDYTSEEDDLNTLDIPDLPQNTLPFTNISRQPITLISQPLPGNSIVADALAPFPSPAPQDEGCCKSKYQHDANLNACLEHFRDSKYWDKEHADDVVFSDILADSTIIPVEEVMSTIRQRRAHPESTDECNRDSRSQSRTVPRNQESLEVNITIDRMERELAETKAKLQAKLDKRRAAKSIDPSPSRSVKVEQPHPRDHEIKHEHQPRPQSAASEKPIKSEQDTEDVLAALGVTGAPKPVTSTAWPDQYTGYGSPNGMRVSRSGSSSRADTFGGDQYRVESGSDQVAVKHETNDSISHVQRSRPPPPPPLPFGQHSYSDGTDGSPLSAGTTNFNPSGYSTNGADHRNGNSNGFFTPSTDGQAPSPIEIRSEKSFNRKRHRESSSDEEDTPSRRQEDDYTPKLKKRQPKVAEAYGRRW